VQIIAHCDKSCGLSRRCTLLWADTVFSGRLIPKSRWNISAQIFRVDGRSRFFRNLVRLRLKCDGTRAKTRFRFWAKRRSPFKRMGASVLSPTGRRAVHVSLQGLYCSCKPVFCNHVTLTGYPLHSLVSPSLILPCFTVCNHISTWLYLFIKIQGVAI
jgi:hypothetical protein